MKKLIILLFLLSITSYAFACYLNTSCFFRCLEEGESVRTCMTVCSTCR
jgi:hypothetical protein